MRDEQQDIDEEGQQRCEEGKDADDEDEEEVADGVRRGVEVGGKGQDQHDQGQEGGNGVEDEDGRQGRARRGREVKGSRVVGGEESC